MNVEQLVTLLDDSDACDKWMASLGVQQSSTAHETLVSIADTRMPLDLLAVLGTQLATHLPTLGDPDLAFNALGRFVNASRNALAFGALVEEDQQVLPVLLQMFSASSMLADLLVADPESFDLLRITEGQPVDREQLIYEICGEVNNLADRRDVMSSLRNFKRRETLRIAYGDIVQRHDAHMVAQQLTFLADALCEAALQYAQKQLRSKRGSPRSRGEVARFVMIGLTRFGGNEMDYGTELRALFIYEVDGRTDGERPMENREFFDKLVAEVIDLLNTQTELGVAYQINVDKTPANRENRFALTFQETQRYFDTRGRTWERQALIRARPLAGDISLGLEFIDAIEPWVYRRYLSRADVTGIKALKRRIGRRAQRKGAAVLDVEGGVFDVEFAVQYLQLINGGDQREVRVGNTLNAIAQLEISDCITPAESQTLSSNYDWLRRVEHRLEIMHGPTTHELPSSSRELRQLALRCGYEPKDHEDVAMAFRSDYDSRTQQNQDVINRLLDDTFSEDFAETDAVADLVLDPSPRPEQIESALSPFGFRDSTDAYHSLSALAVEQIPFLSTRRCRHFLSLIGDDLLKKISATPSPDATLANLYRVSASIGGKGVLWQLFHSHPPTLDLYVRLCSSSPYLTSILTRYPGMIDELLDSLMLAELPTLGELQMTLNDLCSKVEDIEPVLHSFKNTQHLNVGVRELLGKATIRESTATLADVAESCLQHIAQDEHRRLVRKYGQPYKGKSKKPCELVILAMGKFGAREPNYHSDVDVIFLYEADGSTQHPPTIRGRETTSNQHFFGELGQRVVKAISDHGVHGRLYDSDSRLRPVGITGPIAVSLDEFRNHYLSGNHKFSELRQFCQARPVFGSEVIRAKTTAVLQEVLVQARIIGIDAESIRMERLAIQDNAGPRNLKRGPGGTADIEFIVQVLLLRYAGRDPSVLHPNTFTALDALAQKGILEKADAAALSESYQFLRRVEARLRLLNTTARHDLPREVDELTKLTYLLNMGRTTKLEAECARVTKLNRKLFDKLISND